MKSVWTRTICRVLVALMIWTPYYIAQAGVITTDQAVGSAASQADRTTVLNFLTRGDVTSQLQSLGVDPSSAKQRVAALSDAEAASLAQRINAMPAGASDDWAWVLLVIVIAAGVWWFFFRK
ncbi:MAG TPA: PA2779 family protein [Burkholderiales bacterium]|nr:PA2779 family protein [Burkholderiales bacterium]